MKVKIALFGMGLAPMLVLAQVSNSANGNAAGGAPPGPRSVPGAQPGPPPPLVGYDQGVEIGPHHRRRPSLSVITNGWGESVLRTNSYVAIQTGLHYQKEGAWLESQEVIARTEAGAAVADKGLHKAKFAANLNTDGAVELAMSDGKQLRSHVLGLIYFDAASGQSVAIANVRDAVGEIVPPNQVVYRNAFAGLKADVRYTYTKGGIEQDIILLEAPKPPENFGLNSATTRIEAMTEILNPPAFQRVQRVVKRENDPARRQAMAEPDIMDEELDFGPMQMGLGRSFGLKDAALAGPAAKSDRSVAVSKRLMKIDNRDLLVESVEYTPLQTHLKKLPRSTAQIDEHPQRHRALVMKSLAQRRMAEVRRNPLRMQVAQTPYSADSAVVLDYIVVNNANNFTFLSGTTYYVNGAFTCSGTTTIQGGAVIKYKPNDGLAGITLSGPVSCQTSPTAYAYFTAQDDNTIGETISGSAGSPSGYYGAYQLQIYSDNASTDLSYLSFKYGNQGIIYSGSCLSCFSHALHDSRFDTCGYGIWVGPSATVSVNNVNMCNVIQQTFAWEGSNLTTTGITTDCGGQVAAPIFNPNGGSYSGSVTVSLSSATSGAAIRYTLDGSTPTVSSALYSAPLGLTYSVVLKARAFKSGMNDSDVSSASFTVSSGGGSVGLGEAVDNTSLTWATGGNGSWIGQTSTSYNGGDAAQSADISDGQSTYLQTTVVGPGTLNFAWKVSSETSYDFLSFFMDGVLQTRISGEVNWSALNYNVSSGSHTLKWEYSKDGSVTTGADAGWLDLVQFTPTGGIALPDAVDNTSLSWTTGGTASWIGQSSVAYNGGDAAQSGLVNDSQSTFLQTTVTGAGSGNFYWKVSSEANYDYLGFYIDGTMQVRIAGEVPWTFQSFTVGAGSHTLKWEYSKDGSIAAGTDAGWVDWVQFNASGGDTDLDGLPDSWEQQYFGNLSQNGGGDFDGDGVTNLQEYQNGTNPTVSNSTYTEISKSLMTADASSYYPPWPPQFAIDGSEVDPGWHNCCYGSGGEWLRVTLNQSYSIGRVKYRPRSPIHNGAYLQYRIFVTDINSTDPSQWGAAVASGSWDWPNGAETRTISFSPKQGRYVIFQCVQGVGGYASADEVWVYSVNGGSPPPPTDSDNDGLPDNWELQYFGTLSQTAGADPDGDGLTNLQEYQTGTNPTTFDLSYTEISKSLMTADASSYYPPWPPQFAIDGSEVDPGWHNCCYGSGGEWLRVTLNQSYPIGRVKYRPRSPIHNGVYLQYRIFVTDINSTDPSQWGAAVASGSWDWPNGAETRTISFSPKQGRYVIFQCVQGVGGYASADEVWVYQTNLLTDTDSDGLADSWELQNFGNLNQAGTGDYDGDGLTNLQEYLGGTSPTLESGLKVFTPLEN